MSHSPRSSAALVVHHASALDLPALLDAIVRTSDGLLTQVARDNLRCDLRQDAEDVVQDMFIALLEMLPAVAADAKRRSFRSKRYHKRR